MSEPRTCCEYHRLKDEGKRVALVSGFAERIDPEQCREAIEFEGEIDPEPPLSLERDPFRDLQDLLPALALLRRCRAVLEDVQWKGHHDGQSVCPWCLTPQDFAPPQQHTCELAALLAELRALSAPPEPTPQP
jgi:hypothetical protein